MLQRAFGTRDGGLLLWRSLRTLALAALPSKVALFSGRQSLTFGRSFFQSTKFVALPSDLQCLTYAGSSVRAWRRWLDPGACRA
jgi:hypothetical protein